MKSLQNIFSRFLHKLPTKAAKPARPDTVYIAAQRYIWHLPGYLLSVLRTDSIRHHEPDRVAILSFPRDGDAGRRGRAATAEAAPSRVPRRRSRPGADTAHEAQPGGLRPRYAHTSTPPLQFRSLSP
jgi:hypothetical protein